MLRLAVSWFSSISSMASFVAQMVKNLPAMQETWVRSLDWEYPLEKGMATHSSILAWRLPMDRGAWRATVHGGHKESDRTERHAFTFSSLYQTDTRPCPGSASGWRGSALNPTA